MTFLADGGNLIPRVVKGHVGRCTINPNCSCCCFTGSMYYYTVLEWWEYGLSGEDMTRDGEFKISYLIWIVIIEGILFDFEVPTFWLTLL